MAAADAGQVEDLAGSGGLRTPGRGPGPGGPETSGGTFSGGQPAVVRTEGRLGRSLSDGL